MTAELSEWVLLAYRLPREPSTPRINVWRKLRRLGAVQVVDGLVTLPASARNREQFDWLADEVVDAGGEAWTWTATPGTKAQQRILTTRMSEAAAEEYRALIDEAEEVAGAAEANRRTLDRLQRELRAIEARDPVGPKERERARRVLARLTKQVEAPR
jgi:hypothetical protein